MTRAVMAKLTRKMTPKRRSDMRLVDSSLTDWSLRDALLSLFLSFRSTDSRKDMWEGGGP